MRKIDYRPLKKINTDSIHNQIKFLLMYDIETLKYLKIYYVNSEKTGDSLFKQVAVMLTIFVFINNIFIRNFTGLLLTYSNIAILVLTFLWLFYIRDLSQKHKEEIVDLEIINYCINFKELHSNLDYIQLVDKFDYISNNVKNS